MHKYSRDFGDKRKGLYLNEDFVFWRTKGRRARDRSPNVTASGSTVDRQFPDNQKEDSVESIDGNHSPPWSSPANVETDGSRGFERKDAVHDELLLEEGSTGMEREEMALNTVTTNDTLNDENVVHSVQKQKLSSQVEQPSYQNNDDREEYSKAARSSENSKARSGSSKDYRKSRDPVEEEVVQGGRSTRTRIIKRPVGENEDIGQRKDRDERQEIEKHHVTVKGREDSYSRKNWDPNLVHPLHVKTETIDRRKESDTSEVAWQRRGEDPHGKRTRPEDTRKREHSEEMGSRHRSKVRENERSDRDDHHQLRNYFDNGSWRAHDKDMGSRYRDRDDNLKSRSENMDDLHIKRRKDETQSRRDNADKDVLHIHTEESK
ncbi:unnamed protein product [Ilex paraguariensis]|uniref:FIP1[V]-like protein n=1 Tax=Ilex paraguariensis TaxID=185542 RepID=A0ABC8THB1_9AQUA